MMIGNTLDRIPVSEALSDADLRPRHFQDTGASASITGDSGRRNVPEVIYLQLRGDEPSWFVEGTKILFGLLSLPPNWDSYGARSIDREVINFAARFLHMLALAGIARPAVLPTPRGGVQFEWHKRDVNLEVEFMSPVYGHMWYENLDKNIDWEGDISWSESLRPNNRLALALVDFLATKG